MASLRLLLPPSAALCQSPPSSPIRILLERCRHGMPHCVSSRSLVFQTETVDAALTAKLSSETRNFGGDAIPSVAEGEFREEEEAEEEEKEEDGSASEPDVRGSMLKYAWSRPRKGPRPVSREERMSTFHSLLNCQSNFVAELDRARIMLSPSDFGRLLEQFVTKRRWEKVGLLFDWMKVNRKLRPHSLSVYITLMGKAGLCYRALRAYNGLTDKDLKLNKYVANSLLKGLIDAGRLDRAFTLFEELKSDGFTPDEYSYSTVIAGCSKHPDAYEKAKKLMEEMLSSGVRPNEFIYSSMLNVYTKTGHEIEAKALMREMLGKGLQPASFHYSPFLNMYAEKKKIEEAEKVLEDFQNAGLELNEAMLSSLIKVYLSCGLFEKAVKLFEDMPSHCCPPGVVTYSIMINAYCKAGLVEKAHLLFEDLKLKRTDPGNHAYSILMSTYAKMGNVEMVTSLSNDLESRKEAFFDTILFNAVLKSFCELGLMDAVMKTLKKMNKGYVIPDRATFNILICFFCKQGMLDIAFHTLNDLKAQKLRPNLNSYAPLIAKLADSGKVDEAVKLLTESKEQRVQLPEALWTSVLEALCRDTRCHEVLTHFKTMKDYGFGTSPSQFQNILVIAGKHVNLLHELLDNSIVGPNVLRKVNLAIVLSTYKKEGFYASMHKLLDYLESKHITVDNSEQLEELISTLKQGGELDILTKLEGRVPEMQLSAGSSAS